MAQQFASLAEVSRQDDRRKVRDLREKIIEGLLFLCALFAVGVTTAIVVILVVDALPLFKVVSLWDFLTGREWSPLFEPPAYGIVPLVCGTLSTTLVALAVAVPLGTVIAIYLTEFAAAKVREVVKPILELLAGVPTVVYGYFALLVVSKVLQATILPNLPTFNMLSAGLVMGIMIIPQIASISEDAMRAVPVGLKEGSYATGATRLQTAWNVVLPAAISGVSSSYILGISRAVGETMIVAIAAGGQPIFLDPEKPLPIAAAAGLNPMEGGQTVTAYIVQVSLGDLPHDSIAYQSIFAAGLSLAIVTLMFNVVGHYLSQKYREKY
ncbi:MAG: phosphate ABC transporter permease subunit PstC [Synechococcales bacterium]|nr:phosphate ABC transporter permease subunit PstC [Synechococcales bacterium]